MGPPDRQRVEFTGDADAAVALFDALHDQGLTVRSIEERDGPDDSVTTSVLVGGGWAAWDKLLDALRRWPFTGGYRVLDGAPWSASVDRDPPGTAAR